MVDRQAALAFLRKNGAPILIEVLVNFVSPYLIYVATKQALGDVRALIASSAPPLLWSIAMFVRARRMDALSLLVLGGIVFSLLAFLGGGSARWLQLRENFVSILVGIVFLVSAAIGRPLIYQLARATMQRRSASEFASFVALRDNERFRHTMMLMTLVWGFGLVAAAAVSCGLLFVVSIGTYLLVSPTINYGAMGALSVWTFRYGREQRRKGDAARAAAAKELSG